MKRIEDVGSLGRFADTLLLYTFLHLLRAIKQNL